MGRGKRSTGLKPKDLVGIPWRIAFALQDDGWYLRSDIIWHKPNAMPESVRDRPTTSHEYIFLLTKNQDYFYDHVAVQEPFASTVPIPTWENTPIEGERNKRSVWSINLEAYPGAHFAVFPEELPAVCIKAGTSEKGCCRNCGTPWRRSKENLEWEPGCRCKAEEVEPCIVLDPFAGSGTTLAVAAGLNRSYLGIELGSAYLDLIRARFDSLDLAACASYRELFGMG